MFNTTRIPCYLLLFISLCLYFTGGTISASVPKRITFEKEASKKNKYNVSFTYRVQEGNTIYSILQYFNPDKKDLSNLINKVKEMNPHIRNIDRIYPGQELKLPEEFKNNTANTTPFTDKYHQPVGNYETQKYTVKSGDYLIKVLKEEGGVSNKLIYNEYLELFQKLNPDISDFKKLKTGQEITLPTPVKKKKIASSKKNASRAEANKTTASRNQTLQGDKKVYPLEKVSDTKKYLALNMLKKMGFEFTVDKRIFLPANSTKWDELDSTNSPLAVAPWGEKYIFLFESNFPDSLIDEIRKEGITICKVGNNWDKAGLFQELEKKSEGRFIFWNRAETLIINSDSHVQEIQGDFVFVVNMSPKSYFVFTKTGPEAKKVSSILSGYLAKHNIRVFNLQEQYKKITAITTKHPLQKDLYLPNKSRSEVLSFFNKNNVKSKIELGKKIESGMNFLRALQKKELAEKKTLRIKCLKGSSNEILLNISATKLLKTDRNALLFPPALKGKKYLIALLNLYGYPAYVLSQ